MLSPRHRDAFLQATRHGSKALQALIKESVGDARRVADLFAGCGTFSLPLAEHAEVHAVESDKPMMDALDRGWRYATGLKPVTIEARDLFRRPLLPDELQRFDAVVLGSTQGWCCGSGGRDHARQGSDH